MTKQQKSKPKLRNGTPDKHGYKQCVDELLADNTVQMMKRFRHHHSVTCYDHCLNVSVYSFLICKALGLDYKSAARGGLLHDLFLYDWRTTELSDGKHAFRHPEIALTNAEIIFELNKVERDIIKKHMWPLTLKFPVYKESLVVCFVDKYCATAEIIRSSALGLSIKVSRLIFNLKNFSLF